jgi:hypothetical protein
MHHRLEVLKTVLFEFYDELEARRNSSSHAQKL